MSKPSEDASGAACSAAKLNAEGIATSDEIAAGICSALGAEPFWPSQAIPYRRVAVVRFEGVGCSGMKISGSSSFFIAASGSAAEGERIRPFSPNARSGMLSPDPPDTGAVDVEPVPAVISDSEAEALSAEAAEPVRVRRFLDALLLAVGSATSPVIGSSRLCSRECRVRVSLRAKKSA